MIGDHLDPGEQGDEHTYKLINMLERAPKGRLLIGGELREVVHPTYILASDVQRIVRLLAADTIGSRAAWSNG